ncbi:hypothetical protein [Pseudomonas gingeri]|uniref:Uncharacterized protein n=1 Tax=Pseudomonas gingeri TaxID=117681 RepID=A0A7Y8BV55_9PSED|nr:hypothetical protein [Pseudomonas gingeri]NWB88412.1 hypothetical protein [Pseudomonas gingeri]
MIKSLGEQHATPDINDFSFDERLNEKGTYLNGAYLTANWLIWSQKNEKRLALVYSDSCEHTPIKQGHSPSES